MNNDQIFDNLNEKELKLKKNEQLFIVRIISNSK